jgi:hypothetical protein
MIGQPSPLTTFENFSSKVKTMGKMHVFCNWQEKNIDADLCILWHVN